MNLDLDTILNIAPETVRVDARQSPSYIYITLPWLSLHKSPSKEYSLERTLLHVLLFTQRNISCIERWMIASHHAQQSREGDGRGGVAGGGSNAADQHGVGGVDDSTLPRAVSLECVCSVLSVRLACRVGWRVRRRWIASPTSRSASCGN